MMDGLAIYLIVMICFCVLSPKSVGRWAADAHKAYRTRRAALGDHADD